MHISNIIEQLCSTAMLMPASQADKLVPHHPGLYSIFVDEPRNLPAPFGEYLSQKGTRIIYVGKADDSLQCRLVQQDLRHRCGASTFFRGIGAVIGFRPPVGSLRGKRNRNNYRFSETDTLAIINWIDRRLSVRWVATPLEQIGTFEPEAIRTLRPLLNWTHNPDKLQELAALRAECRRIALSCIQTDKKGAG